MAYSNAQKNATIKYIKENLDQIVVRVPKGKKEQYKKAAEEQGKSLTQFIVDLVENEIEKKSGF